MSDPQISDIKFRTEAENNLSCKVREYGPDKFWSNYIPDNKALL